MIKTIFDIDFRFKDIKGKYSSFFDWYRFTIPSKYRKGWEYEDMQE